MADVTASPSLMLSYAVVVLLLIVPHYVFIHHYLHCMIAGPLLVWIGCQRALIEASKAPEDSQAEMVSKTDAMQFPLIGSAVLFGLYVVVKFVNKEYLDVLISCYFAILGAMGVYAVVRPPLADLGLVGSKSFEIRFHWQYWKAAEKREAFELAFTLYDVGVFALCACASVAYALKKTWYLNNLLGAAFSIQGIEMISLGSYVIGCLLLCGLFVYDVFWVFGTEVMVAVAKNLNAPVKILFPKAVNVTPIPVSMLGLGDIVIPGIFVALMLRFDAHLKLGSTPYFASNLAAYVVGLGVTIGVMHFFDAAQPALLYLVPACIGASLLTAAARGEVQTLLNFSVEKPKDAKED